MGSPERRMREPERGGALWLALLLVASPAALAASPAALSEPEVRKLHFGPEQAFVGRYQHVPFEVGPGVSRIEIGYRYDRAGGANVVDLGLLEPGPLELGTAAFRGWTGGEREEIFVAADSATPGYWPGPIPPGRWHVHLGLYKVSPAGVDVELTIRTVPGAAGAAPVLAGRPPEPIRRGAGWYAGGLHAHTLHSDGKLTPQQLAEAARADGLDFLAITDHNNTAHQLDRIDVPGLLVIPGEEVTTPGGHLNVWGLPGPRAFVDFRVLPGEPGLREELARARARGALVSINHPFAECAACSWTHALPEALDALEIANRDVRQLAQSIALWDALLRAGRRVAAIGASDYHRLGENPIGTPSVRVWAEELAAPAILGAIREGRVVVMADGRTPPPELTVRAGGRAARVGDTLEAERGAALEIEVLAPGPAYEGGRVDLVWRGETVATGRFEGGSLRFTRWASADGYLRVHVFAAGGAPLAVTNPVFVKLSGR